MDLMDVLFQVHVVGMVGSGPGWRWILRHNDQPNVSLGEFKFKAGTFCASFAKILSRRVLELLLRNKTAPSPAFVKLALNTTYTTLF